MNWVGGVRNRLKTKDEKRRQKEFFEKMKYGSKVRRLKRPSSPTKASLPTSLDLLSLQAAEHSANKFRKSDAEKSSKSKVKKIEMDRSRGLFPFHHHQELPMAPGTPSKLQLQEPEERHLNSLHTGEHLQRATSNFTFPPSTEIINSTNLYWNDVEEHAMSGPHQTFLSSQFHSTPMTETNQPLQLLKHQGKHFEDLFFSFAPPGSNNNDNLLAPQEELPSALFEISDDWKSTDEFDYSPLSSVPSESIASGSASSSPMIISPDSQQDVQLQDIYPPRETKMRCTDADIICEDDEDIASNTSQTTTCEGYYKLTETRLPLERKIDIGPKLEKVDLICEEMDDFLSPCKKTGDNLRSGSEKSRKMDQQDSDVLGTCPEVKSKSSSSLSKLEPSVMSLLKKQHDPSIEETNHQENSSGGVSGPQTGMTNSFKWKAFVSGHDLVENPPTLQKDRNVKRTATQTMSKVCKQVLQEVLQLDKELCQSSPHQTSKTGSLSSMMDFINFPVTKNNNNMEKFSIPIAEVPEYSHKQISDREPDTKQPRGHTSDDEQQVPDQNQQHTTALSEKPQIHLSTSYTEPEKEDNHKPDTGLQHSIIMSSENCENQNENRTGNPDVSSDDEKATVEISPGIVEISSDSTCQEKATSHVEPEITLHSTLSDTINVSTKDADIHYEDKATQCNIYTLPSVNKETQCTVTDLTNTESLCGETKPLIVKKSNTNALDPGFLFDTCDGCTVC